MTRRLPAQAAGTACHTVAIDRLAMGGTRKDLSFEQTRWREGGKDSGEVGTPRHRLFFLCWTFLCPDMINNPFVRDTNNARLLAQNKGCDSAPGSAERCA